MNRYLVPNVGHGNVIVDLDRSLIVHEQVHNVSHSRGRPSPPLIVELVETLRTSGVSVTGGGIFYSIASL